MGKRLLPMLLSALIVFSWFHRSTHAAERVVMNSIPNDIWYENVYLLADKIDWKEYRNFDVQIGNEGSLHHFPTWKSGKYGTKMFREDLNRDKQEEIIIVLDNFNDPIHIMQYGGVDPNQDYKEVPVESVAESVRRLVKMEKKGDYVTITTRQKTYTVNLKSIGFKDTSSDDSVYTHVPVDYFVDNKKLIADAVVMISTGGGGAIGNLKLTYDWTGKKYEVKSVIFEKYVRKPKAP